MKRAPGRRLREALLALYPREFRELCGDEILAFLEDRLSGLAEEATPTRLSGMIWIHVELAANGIAERVNPLRSRRLALHSSILSERSPAMLTNFLQDLGYALRNLRRAPGFAATVLTTLGLGIGANVAIFSVINGVVLAPMPFADPDRVIQVAAGPDVVSFSEPGVADVRDQIRGFSRVGVYTFTDGTISGGTEPERVRMARVSGGFFPTLAPRPFLGRLITEGDDQPGAPDAIVISYGLWQRHFAMDSTAIGRTLSVNGSPRTVVGVIAPHFDFPTATVSVWTPLRLDRQAMVTRNNHYLRLIARLAPGVTPAQADAELRGLRDRWKRDYPETYAATDELRMDARPIRDQVVGPTKPYLLALFGAVGFVLLIAIVNVANLLLARGETRNREMMIRTALGATRGRIVAQLSAETTLLTVTGGAIGVAIAWPTLRLIVAAMPATIPRGDQVVLDARALGFAVAVCVLTGLLVALAPVGRTGRIGSLAGLNSGARNASGSGGREATRLRSLLVVSEVALSVMMLAGATLFVRSLLDLRRTDLGFSSGNVLSAKLSLPRSSYTEEKAARFMLDLQDQLERQPGVSRASAMAWTPIIEGGGHWSIVPEGAAPMKLAQQPRVAPQQVTPGFFRTVSIPLSRGREIEPGDDASSPLVAVVNEALAKQVWSTPEVIGKRFRMSVDGSPWVTVVGVAGNTRSDGLTEPAPSMMYIPHAQARISAYFSATSMTVLIRANGQPVSAVPALRRAVKSLDPGVPLSDIRPLADVVASSIARHRFTTLLLSGLAGFAVLLAALGIYGVIAYSVTQRRYELGVRMALGASRSGVLALVMREGLGVVGLGLVAGLAGTLAIQARTANSLFGVEPLDAMSVAVVSGLLLAVATAALFIPARRATLIDPTESIRGPTAD